MASTCTFLPNSIHLRRANTLQQLDVAHPQLRPPRRQKRRLPLQALAASSAAGTLPINVDYLVREFSGRGVSFESIGESCVVKMALDNGSLAKLMLPSGLITSYKPFMWHGTTLEVLHTTVSQGEDGEAVIQGGVSVDFKCINDEGGMPWSPRNWALRNVTGSSDKSIQIELGSVAPENMAEFKCVVTLQHNLLASEFTVINPRSSSLRLLGCVMNHLTVSTPDATYAVGLQGSNYQSRRPINTEFSIIPPDSDEKISSTSGESWAHKAIRGLFSSLETTDGMKDEATEEDFMIEESEGEEADDYAHMTDKMCRIYASAPREFTVIDRGRRNSVSIGRSGFDEIYVRSPGSKHDWYGKYAYICIGPTMQTPVALGPGEVWKGAQYLHNPNL